MRIFRIPVRVSAVIRKELREIGRRPGAIVSLVVGPILVMALFGAGFTGQRQPIETMVVVPQGIDIPRDADMYQRIAGKSVHVRGVTDDAGAARAMLERDEVYMVVIVPTDAWQKIERGEQPTLTVETNELDPTMHGAILVVAEQIVRELNAEIIRSAATQGYARLTAAGAQAPSIPPDVVAHPFKGVVVDRAPVKPAMLTFFAPAVLALVLQHLGMTLTALSMVRERLSGAIDIFRVSPIGAVELLTGKYLAYAVLSVFVTVAVVLATTVGLGIPFRGAFPAFALAVGLLTFASLGLGLLISLVSDSERQAVQLSMLVLLFTVFFSGFVLSVNEFAMPVRAIAYALPATYGIALFQDEMLRGAAREPWMLSALAGIGGSLFLLCALRLRGVLRTA